MIDANAVPESVKERCVLLWRDYDYDVEGLSVKSGLRGALVRQYIHEYVREGAHDGLKNSERDDALRLLYKFRRRMRAQGFEDLPPDRDSVAWAEELRGEKAQIETMLREMEEDVGTATETKEEE